MNIRGIEGMTTKQVSEEISKGGRFVFYRYCISVIVLTFWQSSDVYFIPAGKNAAMKGLRWTLTTLLLGWWGIPWGPVRTVQSLSINLSGGKDVTAQIQQQIDVHELVAQ
jgi:hypothetical protein